MSFYKEKYGTCIWFTIKLGGMNRLFQISKRDKCKPSTRGPCLTLYHTILTFNDPETDCFWKHLGKGETAGNQHFFLFPQCFLTLPNQFSILHPHFFSCLQMLSIWTILRLCCLVKSYGWIKILQTIVEKGHPRNIPVKLFQNLSCSSRGEDF